MCEVWDEEVRHGVMDLGYSDEQTWKKSDPVLVEQGERAELDRFKKRGVDEYVSRDQAQSYSVGKIVKVKWARANKASEEHHEVRCRLVAQELGYGERLDELFAGTPSLPL